MIPNSTKTRREDSTNLSRAEICSADLVDGACVAELRRSFLDALPPGERAGLVYATGYAEDLQHMLIMADLLRERGIETVLAAPSHLTCGRFGRPRLLGEPVDWILRFFPGEWYGYLDNIRDWCRAVAKIPVLNPLSRLVRQSKALYALWRDEPLLDEADTALLNQYTPYTELFRTDRASIYLSNREQWVLKKIFGRMATPLSLGAPARRLSGKNPRRSRQDPGGVRCNTPLCRCRFRRHLAVPALGVYLVDGAFAGYYSCADELGFTTNEACHVVTNENP